ncbi:gamma-glutamyltransferase [Persicimonas caeni]|uniref:Gamma-glutamyltransferase n=1 Tax=Persicimonas caeni TaxID=2292766 RepID=A0A4Y6PNY3_PERCE|nr:gamma-glutamyltransferase [Persicimonas caeni]QDG49913.1 gamma-glutamyltransferase [Persicimonas caeni]QED31134.1 gamma-glutamyltransferase [Persicimonas caeni]
MQSLTTACTVLRVLLISALLATPVAGIAQEQPNTQTAQGGQKTERARAPAVHSARGIVATDHPQASAVGARILANGGNAADAGAAALLANGVLNPFASGLGGGGFCLYRPEDTGKVHVIDFREKAPKKATRDMFVVDGEPVREMQLRGGKASGIPGEPAGLWALQNRFGSLEWSQVVDPAYKLANDGFSVGGLLEKRLDSKADDLEKHPKLAALFKQDGEWVDEGDTLTRPGLAKTLKLYRDEGPIVFYHGKIGEAIVEDVNEAGGIFSSADLTSYSVVNREPITGTYRGYQVFSMPPPSSGGTTLVETLNILEGFELSEDERDAKSLHLVIESLKHAFADRARWLGDTDFVDVPVARLTSKEYAKELRQKIKLDGVLPLEEYGSHRQVPDDSGTTHVSVIDEAGNMLACTSTINTSFGSMVLVDEYGLIMNNEMGDFTAMPGKPNNYGLIGTGQNAVAPEKRPLSSMSPTLVLRDGKPYLAAGASGGPTIITGTLLGLINMVDFGMTPAEAIAAPRIHHQWRPEMLFTEPSVEDQDRLQEFGHKLRLGPAFNSVQIVVRHPDETLTGVSDPRKMGRPAAEPAPTEAPNKEPAEPQAETTEQ